MPDIVDAATRSRMMSGIRARDTAPEMAVRRFLHRQGFRYRLHDRRLPGRPDVVLPRYRTALFVHGCFWHQHPGCRLAAKPGSNVEFWRSKLERNVVRDKEVRDQLADMGWRSVIVWECQMGDLVSLPDRIRQVPHDVGTRGRERARVRHP
jgi:DNA mismatch endonuclease, patch repair protein